MILFVFEGVKREPDLFRTIQRLYFANREETFEWRLWLFNSGWSFQLGNQRNIADYSQCGCKEAKRW